MAPSTFDSGSPVPRWILPITTVIAVVGPLAAATANQPLRPRPVIVKPAHTTVDARFRDDVMTVKFRDGLTVRLRDGALSDLGTGSLRNAAADALQALGGTWERTHAVREEKLDEFRDKAQDRLGRVVADLNLQFNLHLGSASNIEAVIDALNALDCVEIALPIPVPVPAPFPWDMEQQQIYLDPATAGVGAETIWSITGGEGTNVSIVDLEYSWNFNHQDVAATTLLGPQPNDPFNDDNHGTAVMGILGAIQNGFGTTGIANQANLFTAATNVGGGGCGDTACFPSELCTCPADCGTPPASEMGICWDGLDNDCDGQVDCADTDCLGDPACAGGCGDAICVAGEICTCPGDCGAPLPVETGWSTDGLDNDCDGLVDCADPDCVNDGACNGNGVWDVGRAITTAMASLSPGDVILIEQQMFGPNWPACCANNSCAPGTNCQLGLIPVEWWLPWYNTIVLAVGNGIIVVEAAGNGSQDLDNAVYSTGNGGHWPFLPANDSGAILVGAGAYPGGSDVDRSRLWFSNYGTTVDIQGHGELVLTTGYGDHYSVDGKDLWYTWSFGGTSSGSAIVAGATAVIQSAYNALTGGVLTPAQLLTAMQTSGSPQQAGTFPTTQNIGPRPDAIGALCAALAPQDCNGNSVADGTDIAMGTSQDCNLNCYPDDCEADCDTNNNADQCDLYTNAITYDVTAIFPGSFAGDSDAVGDFDGDNDLDFIVGLPQEIGVPVLMLENDGNGNFTQVLDFDITFWGFAQITSGDIDNDGDLDLVVIESTSPPQLRVAINDGSGNFSQGFGLGLFGPQIRQLKLAHLDGDGNLDLVAMVFNTEEIFVYPGNGDGTFAFPATEYGLSFGASPTEFDVGDLDGDGDRDIAVGLQQGCCGQNGSVDVFFNQGDGTLQGPTNYQTTFASVTSVVLVDVDTDADLDLAVRTAYNEGGSYATNAEILLNDGSGSFGAPTDYNTPNLPVINLYGSPLRTLDANGDGSPDLAAAGPLGSISILTNDGSGGFALDFVTFSPTAPSGARVLEVGDLDADGTADLVGIADQQNKINILLSQTQSPGAADCNGNAQPDGCDIAGGSSQDCQADGIPDECQLAANDCNGNSTPDDCEMTDCNGNGVLDSCDIANGASADDDGNGVPDNCSTTTAPPPTVMAGGSRAITVTPTSGSGAINGYTAGGLMTALLVSAEALPCLSAYVQEDGTLGAAPVYQTPDAWGTIAVTGADIVPEITYTVQSDIGTPGNPILSEPVPVTTWVWGDMDNNETTNLADVFMIVQGFQGNFDNAPPHTLDIWPCTPNGVVNLDDVFTDVLVFQGQSYEELGCALPCAAPTAISDNSVSATH